MGSDTPALELIKFANCVRREQSICKPQLGILLQRTDFKRQSSQAFHTSSHVVNPVAVNLVELGTLHDWLGGKVPNEVFPEQGHDFWVASVSNLVEGDTRIDSGRTSDNQSTTRMDG